MNTQKHVIGCQRWSLAWFHARLPFIWTRSEWWCVTHHNLGDQSTSCPCGTFGGSMGLCSFTPIS